MDCIMDSSFKDHNLLIPILGTIKMVCNNNVCRLIFKTLQDNQRYNETKSFVTSSQLVCNKFFIPYIFFFHINSRIRFLEKRLTN